MSGTVRDERGLPTGTRSYRAVVPRAGGGRRCAARSRADVAAANAFFGKRFRSRSVESRSLRSDTRANAARDGRGIGVADCRPAAGAYIGRPPLERLFDAGPNFILGKAAPGCAAYVDWDLSDSGVDCKRASAQGSQAGVV